MNENLERFLQLVLQDKCHENMTFNLGYLNSAQAETVRVALETGKCKTGLRLSMLGEEEGFDDNNSSLNSGFCDYYSSVFSAMSQALASGHCPENFYLDFSFNLIYEYDVTMLAKAINSGKCPKGLTINLSDITPETNCCELSITFYNRMCAMLANALKNAPENFCLDLSDNKISDKGALAFLEVLKKKEYPPGFQLSLNHNRISKHILKEIRQILDNDQYSLKPEHNSNACLDNHKKKQSVVHDFWHRLFQHKKDRNSVVHNPPSLDFNLNIKIH